MWRPAIRERCARDDQARGRHGVNASLTLYSPCSLLMSRALGGGCDDPIALFVADGKRSRASAHLRHAASMPWQSNTRRETAGHLPPRAAAKASRVWPGGISQSL